MSLDFNTEPFFDDFSEDSKFHRILFRPGYAVQARELTQLQTILQEQVRRHGDHMFKEGSMVIPGQISYDLKLSYVQLVTDINIDMNSVLSSLVGTEIKNSAGLVAKVIAYTLAETVDGVLHPNTIFVKYQNSTQDIAGNNVITFNVGDSLSAVDGTIGLDLIVAEPFSNNIPPVGFGSSATIQRGIYYIKKNFVLVQDQIIILDKYTNTPSYRVGLKLTESIVYPEDDETLLDNALGSPNYAAPGAARYKMDLALSKITVDLDSVTTAEETDFIDLLRLESGNVIFKIDRTSYAEIEKTLARRTYDESGDYALNPFSIQAKDYRNNVRGDWAPGEKFIQGDLINVAISATGKSYFVAVTSGISGSSRPNFLNWTLVDNIVDNQITWEYVQYPIFNQGVHTFTAGDSSFSNFTLNDHIRLDSMIALAVEAGKAYVRGYEIEKIATEYVPAYKSRYIPAGSTALASYFGVDSLPEITDAISNQKTASIDVSMGSYIVVNSVTYVPNLVTLPDYKLCSDLKATASDATVIGYAKIRAMEVEGSGTYKLFLFDIRMNAGKDFSNVKSIIAAANPGTNFSCNTVQTNDVTTIQNPQINSLIFELPDYAISNISQVTYSVVAPLTATASSGVVNFPAPAGYSFESINNPNNYILVNNSTGAIVSNPTYSIVAGALRVTGVANQSHTVLATIKRGDVTGASAQSLRTVTDAPPMYLTTQAAAQAGILTLNHSYVTRIVSVMMSTKIDSGKTVWTSSPVYSTNITNRYSFHHGQDNGKIGSSFLSLGAGMEAPSGPVMIKYEYLASVDHSPGDFIGVNSYTHPTSKMRYDQITTIFSYPLRDSIDFRPYVIGAGFQAHYFPKYGTTATFNYTNFLPRIDNISLSNEGKYILNRGIPSEQPSEPNVPTNSMRLAQVSVEPYTFRRGEQFGVVINRQENKRYTMRDIGKLERRIQDLEYYTSLSLTELETKNMRIVDSSGFDRYQNGFLVDSFDGQGIGNAASDDWNASIDTQKKELRPFFSQKQVHLLENVGAATRNYKVSGDLVTLPFTEVAMIAQTKASITENVNPYALYSWKGIVEINPWSDTWFSTHHRPDVVLNDESQYNAIIAKANADGVLGTVWNSWQVVFSSTKSLAERKQNLGNWSIANTEILNSSNNGGNFWRNRTSFSAEDLEFIGIDRSLAGSELLNQGVGVSASQPGSRIITIETDATETKSTRVGTRSFIVDKVDSRVLEDRVVETQVVPYIRPRAVLFTGYGFKPSTNLYAFFDDIMVNDYVTPATRLKVSKVTKSDNVSFYPYQFDTTRNAGSAVSNPERTVWYNDGVELSGTITVTNGSTTVTGIATAFLQQVQVGDLLNVGLTTRYKVASITDNYTLVLTSPYAGTSANGVSAKIIGPQHNTEEVEVAFNHGEIIREVNGNGNTAIVVGQEVSGSDYYIYVLNIKGTGNFSTSGSAYLEGEYTNVAGEKPRVRFLARQNFSSLTTSLTGLLCGIFRIPSSPALKFRTGTRELKFSDSSLGTNALRSTQESTSGGAQYVAQGLVEIKQRTIVATRTANIVSEQVSDTNTLVTTTDRLTRDTGWFDPLAQTFLVQQEGGAFITSVDLFFQTADPKVPVRVEIREVVNGYPGSAVLPFSRVEKKGSLVATSQDASASTNFKFQSPVFLQNGVEYALVVLSDSNNYRLWISQTDTIDVLTGIRIMSQPYNGVLFKSQNASTWTADQTQDMKFIINRADFAQTPVTIELIPPKLTYANLPFNPFNFRKGEKKCRIQHPSHGMVAGEFVILKSRQVIDSINGIPAAQIFNIPLAILSAELDSYVVEFATASIAEGQVGGGYIAASENYEFSTAMIEIAEVVPPGTSIDYTAKVINHADAISTYKMIPKENLAFEEVKVYPSEANYSSSTFPSGLAVLATLNPSPVLKSISPVIDLSRLAMTMVSNKVDYPTIAVNDVDLDLFPITDVDTATGADIGTEIGSGKSIDLIDTTGDGFADTIVINSLTESTLYNNLNNNLNTGDVLQFTYSGITDAIRNMTITEKVLDTEGNLYLKLEGIAGETIMDTTVGQTAGIKWLSHFKSEYASIGGSTHSKYVTKKINFSRPSEMLKIMFSAIIPTEAEVEIYYKTGLSVSGDFISSAYKRATPSSYTKSISDFVEIVADVEGLDSFDSVMVKLVMKSINKSQVPRIKDFRVIACAA